MPISEIRDIAIIVLAVESTVIGIFLIVLILNIRSLIRLLREEIKPILDSASRTTRAVQSTTKLASDTVVSPLIEIVSYASAARKAAEVWSRWRSQGKGIRGKEEQRKRAQEAIAADVDYFVTYDRDFTDRDETTSKVRKAIPGIMLPPVFLREVMGWSSEDLESIRERDWEDME